MSLELKKWVCGSGGGYRLAPPWFLVAWTHSSWFWGLHNSQMITIPMTKIAAKTRRENIGLLPFLLEDALEGLADALHLVETEPVENDQPNPQDSSCYKERLHNRSPSGKNRNGGLGNPCRRASA